MKFGIGWLAVLASMAAGAALAWHFLRPSEAPPASSSASVLAPTPGVPWFEDLTAAARIDFQHFDSATPMHYIHETFGSGVGWIDYNNDGWPDLFCIQDGPVRPGDAPGALPSCKLFRNNGDGTFTDVTVAVGLTKTGFGMGCAVGDFDNDGYDDLVVTYLGGVTLYHNEPDGRGGRRFVDVTARAGLQNPHFATSCAWGDIDGDGLLDLYVCNYVEIDLAKHPICEHLDTKIKIGCSPTAFPLAAHKLYRNNGDGTFTDISVSAGIAAAPRAPGLGVVMVDLDGDGRLDIYVANDLHPAYLFHNQGGGKFIEKAMLSGCAFDSSGNTLAGMGVDAADVDGSGRPSLFITNYQNEPNILFRNRGGLIFADDSYPSGLGFASLQRLGFGAVFLDADLDGHLDLAIANGHVQRPAQRLFHVPYEQEAQLFVGQGAAKFRDVSDKAGAYFQNRYVGRGVAWADYDNDGLPDLAFSNNAGPAVLLRNATRTENRWVRLELIGVRSNRNAIGARLEIEAGGRKQVRFITGGGSYLSASERRLLVGLGQADQIDRLTVIWPSGHRDEHRNLPAKRWWRLREGDAKPEEANATR